MRLIASGVLLVMFWTGFYTLSERFTDQRLLLAAFVVTLVVSMVTIAVCFIKRQ